MAVGDADMAAQEERNVGLLGGVVGLVKTPVEFIQDDGIRGLGPGMKTGL